MNAVYEPIIICNTCRTSMHDHHGNREVHAAKCHSTFYPAGFRYPLASDVLAAGWTPENFTSWPYL